MTRRAAWIALTGLAMASACAFTTPFRESLGHGDAVPAGAVLVIGKITVDPMVEQGNIGVHAPRGTHRGVVKMHFSGDADKPLDKDALFPFSPSESMDWSFTKTSFIPLAPGTRFARLGALMLESRMTHYVAGPGTAPAPRAVDVTYLMLYGDVKIAVPENAKAVYIGTVSYRHDLKNAVRNKFGYPSKKVVVKDEYKAAMADLAAMKIPGIGPGDVVKKLAVVVREN